MPLDSDQKKHLRRLAHSLKPIVIIGQRGLTESVLAEIDQALQSHELLKIRINADSRDDRARMTESILTELHAELVQSVGNVASLYRRNRDKPKIHFRN